MPALNLAADASVAEEAAAAAATAVTPPGSGGPGMDGGGGEGESLGGEDECGGDEAESTGRRPEDAIEGTTVWKAEAAVLDGGDSSEDTCRSPGVTRTRDKIIAQLFTLRLTLGSGLTGVIREDGGRHDGVVLAVNRGRKFHDW